MATVSSLILPLFIVISLALMLWLFHGRKTILALRRNQEALQKTNSRLMAVFEATPDAVLIYDPENRRMVDFNPAAADLLGYSREEIQHLAVHVLFSSPPPHSLAEGQPYLDAALNGKPQAFEWETLDAAGNAQPLELVILPLLSSAPPLLMFVARKIARQKQLEAALNRFSNIVGQIGEGVAVVDLEGVVTHANQAWADMHGYGLQGIIGRPLSMFHSDDQNEMEVLPITKKVLRTGYYRGEVGHRRSNAALFPVAMTVTLQKDDNGRPVGLIWVAADLAEQKKVEDALRESEVKFRHLFNLSPQPISVTDLNGVVLDVNQRFCEKMQYSRSESIGKNFLDLGFPAQSRQSYLDQLIDKGDLDGFEIQCRAKDGRIRQTQVYAKLIQIKDRFYVLNVFHDVTSQRQLEARLVTSQKMEAIGALAGGIAHDFNHILSAILGHVELAKIHGDRDSRVFPYLEAVFKAVVQAKDLVGRILSISRQGEKYRVMADMGAVVREVLAMMGTVLPKHVEVKEHIDAALGVVAADPVWMQQVVMSLVTNVGQSMGETGGELTVMVENTHIALGVEKDCALDLPDGDYVKLTVGDTGHGISEPDQKRIFDPYYITREQGLGMGLGLAVVQGIVKKHKGAVCFSSKPGQGTCFYVYLPVMDGQAAVAPTPGPEPEAPSLPPCGGEHILLVDDEPGILKATREMLEHLGYIVETRPGGMEALACFRKSPHRFDLVISNMTMPEMSGAELTGQLLKERPDLPVVLCTGYHPDMDEAKARAIGVKAFLFKPITLQQLAVTVRGALGRTCLGF